MTRKIAAIALVVLASVVAFLAIFAIWLNRQALNTDNWTKTSSKLLEQPVVRHRIASRLTDELFTSVDVQAALAGALPARAQALAAPAANALRTQVEKVANQALERPDVQGLWADANRVAHEQLLSVLNGGGTTVSTQNGKVVLDLKQLLALLQSQVGIGGRLQKVLPASATQITLFRSDQLSTAQTVVKVLRPLPVVLILVSLALLGGALLAAPDWRRRAVRAYGIGFILAGGAALIVRSVAGDQFVSSFASTAAAEPSVQTVWTIATELLVSVAVATIIYGLIMVVGAWLAGETRAATATRRAATPYLREPAIAFGVLAVVIALVVWWEPTPAWRNVPMLLILIGLLVAGVEALRRKVIREFPESTRADQAERNRERWGRAVAAGRRGAEGVQATASRAAQSTSGAIAATRQAQVTRSAPVQMPPPEDTRLAQLERLAQLRRDGVLDDAELRAEKERILHDSTVPAEPDGVSRN